MPKAKPNGLGFGQAASLHARSPVIRPRVRDGLPGGRELWRSYRGRSQESKPNGLGFWPFRISDERPRPGFLKAQPNGLGFTESGQVIQERIGLTENLSSPDQPNGLVWASFSGIRGRIPEKATLKECTEIAEPPKPNGLGRWRHFCASAVHTRGGSQAVTARALARAWTAGLRTRIQGLGTNPSTQHHIFFRVSQFPNWETLKKDVVQDQMPGLARAGSVPIPRGDRRPPPRTRRPAVGRAPLTWSFEGGPTSDASPVIGP